MKNHKYWNFFFLNIIILFVPFKSFAQIPTGYYNDADGKSGYTLKSTLYDIIKGHDNQSYSALWDLYKTSDKKSNGKVWDMYSDVPGGTPAYEYTFGSDQCGNYSGEGSCYNREHSFPKSWFNDASPMITDPFHIVPSDGYTNGKRGNYAFGEVGSASWTSTNGSKLGSSNYPGYSGTVFEPIDEYKGDFARGYFYMATRYENVIAGWESNNDNGDAMLNGTSDQVYEDWALEMLIAWHNADPVSQKEIERNDAIYDYQNNRNPFIDHPEYVTSIWGGTTSASIIITETITDFGAVPFGEVSGTQSYTVTGADLIGDIFISTTNDFEISLTDTDQDFTTSLTLSHTSGIVTSTTIYARFKPTSDSNNAIIGSITHTSSGANTKELSVSGTEYYKVVPEINFSYSMRTIDPMENYEVVLYADTPPNDDINIVVQQINMSELSFTTTPDMSNNVVNFQWQAGEVNASFMINFIEHSPGEYDPGTLNFSIMPSDDYIIGSNDNFELVVRGEDVVNGLIDRSQSDISLYPNPASDKIHIVWAQEFFNYAISDLTGRIMLKGQARGEAEVDVSGIKAGQYLISLGSKRRFKTKVFSIY